MMMQVKNIMRENEKRKRKKEKETEKLNNNPLNTIPFAIP